MGLLCAPPVEDLAGCDSLMERPLEQGQRSRETGGWALPAGRLLCGGCHMPGHPETVRGGAVCPAPSITSACMRQARGRDRWADALGCLSLPICEVGTRVSAVEDCRWAWSMARGPARPCQAAGEEDVPLMLGSGSPDRGPRLRLVAFLSCQAPCCG